MTLGMFVFEMDNLPYQELSRALDWRFAQTERFGARAASQFVGAGNETIAISGTLYPGTIGEYADFQTLIDMANTGNQFALVNGHGDVLGQFIIKSMSDSKTLFVSNGNARKIDFSINLERVD